MELFKINETLRQNILKDLPNDYNNLEKAILIYKRLCEKLQYSFDYFLEGPGVENYFRDANNLVYVDGEKNKDVVCFTFNAILSQLFLDANVVSKIDDSFYNPVLEKFYNIHDQLKIEIDNITYYLDATMGVLDNNDLILSKYAGHRPDGWICSYQSPVEAKEKLREVLKKVYDENQSLDSKLEKYVKTKKLDNSFIELPIETRVQMFLELAKTADYSLFGFNNLLKYKHLCFNGNDFGYTKDYVLVDQQIDLIFAKNRTSHEFKAYLFYNPSGYTDDKGYENFDKLIVYEISLKDKTINELNKDHVSNLFNKQELITNTNGKIYPKMIAEGKEKIIYEFEGGKPVYDHHQNPVNVVKKYRKIVKTDKIEELPLE